MSKFRYITLMFILAWLGALAQHKMVFHKLTGNNGLSSHAVTSILQDHKGYMWIATIDGLNRYDGYEMKNYFFDPRDTNSLSSSYINFLYQDKEGIIWIATSYGGLTRFNPVTNRFTRFMHNEKDPSTILDNVVNCIAEDKDGNLWLATESGVNIFNKKTEKFTALINKTMSTSLSSGSINYIFFDKHNTAWVGTEKGVLNKYNAISNTFERFALPDTSASAIFQIDELSEDTLIICSYAGLRFFDAKQKKFIRVLNFIDSSHPLHNRACYAMLKETDKVFWVSNIPKNNYSTLSLIDFRKNNFNAYVPDANDPSSLSNENIHEIFKDRSGTIWLGFNGKGINYFNPAQIKFWHITRNDEVPNNLRSEYVYPIYEDFDGSIWIGTSDGGLNHYFPESGKMEYFEKGVFLNKVASICEAGNGKLWIGLYRRAQGALILFDKKTGKYEEIKCDRNGKCLSDQAVKVVKVARNGLVWIGTQSGGLNSYDPVRNEIKSYEHVPSTNKAIISNEVKDIYEDEKENLWLATADGLDYFDLRKKVFTHYNYKAKDNSSLSNDFVLSVMKDSKKNVWAATSYGLNKLDPETGKFKVYTTKDGMPNSFVYGIIEDGQGYLWFSTNNGLSRFDPVKEHFRNFEVSDGLQSKEFNTYSFHKGRSGKFYFGGVNGLNRFYPEELKDIKLFVPVIITSFKKFGKEAVLDSVITHKKQLRLNYNENFFSFEFTSTDYLLPGKNRYSCMMAGLNNDWIDLGTQHNISYTNLDPGEYVFKVRNTNHEGYWNPNETELYISILPPFWKTKTFYAFCLIFIIVTTFTVYRLRVRSLIKAKQLLEIQVKERTLEIEKQKRVVELQKDEVELQKNMIEEKNREIIDSITYAKRLQDAILPPFGLIRQYIPDSFIFYKPKDIVAGDFYWAEKVDNMLFIAAADCTGHGVPGAMVSLVCSNALNTVVKEFGTRDTGQILDKAAALLVDTFQKSDHDVKDGMDISLLKLEFDSNGSVVNIEWAGANNPLWIIEYDKATGQEGSYQMKKIKPNKQPIGKYDHMKPFTTHKILYSKGMELYLFTDGFPDQFGGEKRKKFMYHQFENLFLQVFEKPIDEQKKLISRAFDNWKGNNEQVDDVTVIGIRL